jgi:apolipoprotein N-acyltransferase
VLNAGDAELIVGGPRRQGTADELRHFNSVFPVYSAGRTQARSDKQPLVPFSESLALANTDLLRRSFGQVSTFTPGGATPPLPTRAGPAGVLLYNEAMIPELASARVRDGAAYLVNPSKGSWIQSRSRRRSARAGSGRSTSARSTRGSATCSRVYAPRA